MSNTDKASLFIHYWRMFADVNLPTPTAEYRFDKHLKRKHRFDWCWPELKIAVEVDGGQWIAKGGRHNTDTDREKLNIAAALGYRVFRFSVQMLERDPLACVNQVAELVDSESLPFGE